MAARAGGNQKKKKNALYVAPEPAHRPRKIGCPEELMQLWSEYKAYCQNHTRIQTFVDKSGGVKNIEVSAPITCTKTGFCSWFGIVESAFQSTYGEDPLYEDAMDMIRQDSQVDCRSKFEDGTLNPKLAPLWMSRYGYSVKQETEVKGGIPVVISGEEALED